MESENKASGFVVQPRLQFENLKDKMLYQHLVEEANYVASSRCEIGQTIIVLTNLATETGWTRDILKGSLNRLENLKYIEMETLPQKRGMLVTISSYKRLQNLTFYQKEKGKKEPKNPQENPHEKSQENPHEVPQEKEVHKPCDSKGEGMEEKVIPQENPYENPQENPHTITALNSINSIRTYKDLRESCKETFPQVTSSSDVESFVNLLSHLDVFAEIKSSWMIRYIDTIRLTRSTCKVSTNVLITFLEKALKHDKDIVHYALATHIINHDDKREVYTLGIMRNTNVHEARRKLMKLLNKDRGELHESNAKDLRGDRATEQHDEYEELYL